MPDQRLSQLTADTTPTSDDIVYAVGDPAGTPIDRKVALRDLAIAQPQVLARAAAITTASRAVVAGEFVPVDTTAGAVVLTLPAAPPNGTTIAYRWASGANSLTVNASGSDRFNNPGGSIIRNVTYVNQQEVLTYVAADALWYIHASYVLGQLDTRYQALDTDLTAIAGLTSAANKVPVFSGAGTADAIDFTRAGWTSYTPTWTSTGTAPAIGNGTLTAAYGKFGDLVMFRFIWIAGTTTTYGTGSYRFSLPLTGSFYSADFPLGYATLVDTSAGTRNLYTATVQSSTALELRSNAGTLAAQTVPWTWANGDSIMVWGSYTV